MLKPTAGKFYEVKSGDTLRSIAAAAYGDAFQYPNLQASNGGITEPLRPGEKLLIPKIAEREALKTRHNNKKLSGKSEDDLTILIDGVEVKAEAASIMRTIDTAADAWAATVKWTPGEDRAFDDAIRPFRYPTASVYLGGNLAVNGLLYGVAPRLSDRRSIDLEGFSYTADVIDSTLTPPYEFNNVTLEQHAKDVLRPVGIGASFDVSSGGKFTRITAEPTDTIFTHLSGLAAQRGLLISSKTNGDLLFTKAKSGGSVGTLAEGQPGVIDWSARFDGRKRFNFYRAYGFSPLTSAKAATSSDSTVPRSRVLTFSADDTTSGNIKNSAEWRKRKQAAESLKLSLPVEGWRSPSGKLWEPNTLLTVVSETLMLPNGFTFLVKSVEFSYSDRGRSASIALVPPGVYSSDGGLDPWLK